MDYTLIKEYVTFYIYDNKEMIILEISVFDYSEVWEFH